LNVAFSNWREKVAAGFHEIIGKEVLAKDLPSFKDERMGMESFGDEEEEEEDDEEEEEEE
jgi:hypothetical protein